VVADLGEAAINHFVARALASIQHRISPDKEGRPYPASLLVKGRRRQNAALT
jgi:hypothetical protein